MMYSDEQLRTALVNARKAGDQEATRAIAGEIAKRRGTTGGKFEAFAAGVSKVPENLAVWAERGINATFGTDFQNNQNQAAQNDAVRAANPNDGMELAGNIVGTAPTLALPGGAFVQGAATGALLSDEQDILGVGKDAFMSGIAGKASEAAMKVAGRVIAPKVSEGIAKLRSQGITMTPGQAARATETKVGQWVGDVEDKLRSMPFVGGLVDAGRNKSFEQFNRAAIDRALKPIGGALPKDMPVGFDGIKFAGDTLSAGYKRVLGQVKATQLSPKFSAGVAAIRSQSNLPAEQAKQFDDIVQREVLDKLSGGTFDGRILGNIMNRLDKVARPFQRNADNVYIQDLGDAVQDLRQIILAEAGRAGGKGVKARLSALNRGYAELVRVERAALGTPDGVFSPGQYNNAIKMADGSVRRRGYARGTALGQKELGTPAAQALPSKVADSQTAGRTMQANLPSLALGGALTLPYAAAQGATNLVTRNPGPMARGAANALIPLRPGAVAIGATTLPPLLAGSGE